LITWQWAPDRGSARQVGKLLSLMCPGRTFARTTAFSSHSSVSENEKAGDQPAFCMAEFPM
jgi:hypothetical protein